MGGDAVDAASRGGRFGLGTLIRTGSWWDFKLPPQLCVAYLLIGVGELDLAGSLLVIAQVVVCIASAASFGHVLNDVFDVESDRLAGKPNAMARAGPVWCYALLALFVSTGFLPLLLGRASMAAMAALGAIYGLAMIYSIPPLRTKERGVIGPLCDASAAHVMPTLLVFALFGSSPVLPASRHLLALGGALVWQACFGFRAILLHQVVDLANDKISGTATYATRKDVAALRALAGSLMVPELLGVLTLMVALLPSSTAVLGFAVAYIAVALVWQKAIKKRPYEFLAVERGARVPFFELYEFFLPLAGAVSVAFFAAHAWVVLLLHLALFQRRFRRGFRVGLDLLASPARSKASAG